MTIENEASVGDVDDTIMIMMIMMMIIVSSFFVNDTSIDTVATYSRRTQGICDVCCDIVRSPVTYAACAWPNICSTWTIDTSTSVGSTRATLF